MPHFLRKIVLFFIGLEVQSKQALYRADLEKKSIQKGKHMIRLIMSLITVFTFTLVAQADPTTVVAQINKVYAPEGFDSNDIVQIVVQGKFPNSCYRAIAPELKIDRETKEIFIKPLAFQYPGICLMYIVPFEKSIDLGLLQAGTWKIYQGQDKASGEMASVVVKSSKTENPDDYTYTPVTQVTFKQAGETSTFTMTGEFTNNCMSLDKIEVNVQKDVVVLQPIAKISVDPTCKNGSFPFTGQAVVKDIPGGKFLVHVRSMNGNSINSFVNVDFVK